MHEIFTSPFAIIVKKTREKFAAYYKKFSYRCIIYINYSVFMAHKSAPLLLFYFALLSVCDTIKPDKGLDIVCINR